MPASSLDICLQIFRIEILDHTVDNLDIQPFILKALFSTRTLIIDASLLPAPTPVRLGAVAIVVAGDVILSIWSQVEICLPYLEIEGHL